MKIVPLLLLFFVLQGCDWGPFRKDNPKEKIETSELLKKIESSLTQNYCPKSLKKYIDQDGKFHKCDSALFAGLLGIACPGVDLTPFENEQSPGQICRTWACDCYNPDTSTDNGSDSQYSKDMNAGIQLNMAVRLNERELVERIIDYLTENNLVMCEAINEITWLSKCILPPASMTHWIDILNKIKEQTPEQEPRIALRKATTKKGFERHLAVLGVLKEGEIYGAISDISLEKLKIHHNAQKNNVVYSAALKLYTDGDMREPASLWLDQCPMDRLPNNHDDYCTDYKYQRDEGPNWEPCPDEEFIEHPGVDCAFAAWIILHNREKL
jgi:hypothetical protein